MFPFSGRGHQFFVVLMLSRTFGVLFYAVSLTGVLTRVFPAKKNTSDLAVVNACPPKFTPCIGSWPRSSEWSYSRTEERHSN
jgi:hypothetical protein